ncbi:hypothetical protein BC567DRAFT_247334, partial [Phyllosticta citribraziliensis]
AHSPRKLLALALALGGPPPGRLRLRSALALALAWLPTYFFCWPAPSSILHPPRGTPSHRPPVLKGPTLLRVERVTASAIWCTARPPLPSPLSLSALLSLLSLSLSVNSTRLRSRVSLDLSLSLSNLNTQPRSSLRRPLNTRRNHPAPHQSSPQSVH